MQTVAKEDPTNPDVGKDTRSEKYDGLVKRVIDAHGGLDQWRQFEKLTATVVSGGFLWAMKGFEPNGSARVMTTDLRRQRTRIEPFGDPEWRLIYEPESVVIGTLSGDTIAEERDPRDTFAGHLWETPWTPTQLGYFSGYAIWTYFNLPFLLSEPGFEFTEIPSISQDGLDLKGLLVRFPDNIHTHSSLQSLYFDEAGLLRRHDYDVDIAGKNPAAHLISDYVVVQGLKFPTKRRVYVRNAEGSLQMDKMPVSIDLSHFELS